MDELGRRVRSARQLRGWSQAELADVVGAHDNSFVSRLERGVMRRPSADRLRALARALGDDADEYLALAGMATSAPDPEGLRAVLREELAPLEAMLRAATAAIEQLALELGEQRPDR